MRSRSLLSVLSHCGLWLTMLVIVTGAACGIAYVRLSHGPVSLKFLAGSIARGINADLNGLSAAMDDAQIALTDGGLIELRLQNLRLTEPTGQVVAVVPTAAVTLSRLAFYDMKLVPSRIDLIDAQISLIYSADGGLEMSFAGRNDPAAVGESTQQPNTISSGALARKVDLAAVISEATQRTRQRLDGSSYLNEIGVRDAVVTLDNGGVRSEWRVLEGALEIDRRTSHAVIAGHATVASDRGPWTATLRTGEADKAQTIVLEATISDLVPRTLGLAIPQWSLMETLDAPISAQATLALTDGVVGSGRLAIKVGNGRFILPAVAEVPFTIDSGDIGLTYNGNAHRFDLVSSTLAWGTSTVSLKGAATADGQGGWAFDMATAGGQLTAPEFGVPVLPIDQGILRGRIVPSLGEARIDQLSFKAGGTVFSSVGVFTTGTSLNAGGAKFDATLGPTSADAIKTLWPRALAKAARTWVGERVKRGTVKSGALHFVSGSFARSAGVAAANGKQQRLSVTAEAFDVAAVPLRWLSPVEAPRTLIRLENDTIEIGVPDATIMVGPNKKIPLKAGRFVSNDLDAEPSTAEITFKTMSPLVPVLDVLDQSPLHLLRANGLTTDGLDGRVDGQMKLTLPLIPDLDPKAVKIEVKAKVLDGKAKQLAGAFDVQGATIAIDVTETAVGATGDLLANGVPVKLGWQRILEENGEKQPPLRLSANLDNADRTQLGLDVNHIVQGEVPLEILIEKGEADEPSVRLRADLTNADISLDALAWKKPPGKAVSLGADIVKGKTHKFELQNLKVSGDDVAIEGWAGIGADNKLHELRLPSFSLSVISRLDVQALLKTEATADKSGVWAVKVKGQNFDGRDLFRSLFAVGPGAEKAAKPGKPSAGIDVEAEIDNVIGHGEVSLRNVKMKVSRRADKLAFLEARGTLDGGAPVALSMMPEVGKPRRLLADTTDAGQAFKLIGFYPNMQLGRAQLEVNVDGRGSAEKTGIVWVKDFRILGDPIVSEVLGSTPEPTEDGRPARLRKKAASREVFEFDNMKVPFSVGYGQFVIENAYLRGPLLGVNLVGKADFKLRTLNLGGTYIPLQGLNNAFGEVPLLGALVSGPKGEGAFGITFAVQGPMSQPQVLANPLSIVAPGIFREIFQMTNPNPKVIPRDEKGPIQPVEKRVRNSSSAAGEADRAPRAGGETPSASVDGWDSTTSPAGKGRK